MDNSGPRILTLPTATEPVHMPLHSAYDLRGAGPSADDADTLRITTPVRVCVECSSPLAPAHEVAGRVYTLSGLRQVVVTTKRCSRKSCRAHHHYNYRKVDGQKYHSLPLEDLEYVFVISKQGGIRTYLSGLPRRPSVPWRHQPQCHRVRAISNTLGRCRTAL